MIDQDYNDQSSLKSSNSNWPNTCYLFAGIGIVTLLKAWLLIYLTQCSNPEIKAGSISFSAGDTFSYIGAMENFITQGNYFFFNGTENVHAGRLPHYGALYFLFRQFATPGTSKDLMVGVQLLMEIASSWVLVLLCWQLTRRKIITILLLCLLLLTSNWTSLSIYLSPESLSVSLLVLFVYWHYHYLNSLTNTCLLLSGLFLGLLVTLKPYYILVFLPVGIHFLILKGKSIKIIVRQAIVKSALVSVPMIALLTPWIIRNYFVYEKFVPLQVNTMAGYSYSSAELAFRSYISAWGGDFIFWEKKSAGCYFMPSPRIDCEFKMPEYAFTSKYGNPEIEMVRQQYIRLQKHESDSLNAEVTTTFKKMQDNYRSEKPIQFYLLSPLRITYRFLVHSGSYYLPIHKTNPCYAPMQLVVKLFQSAGYWLGLIIGLPSLLILSWKRKSLIFCFLPLFLIVLFPFILNAAEARYLRTIEPILYLGVAFMFNIISNISYFEKILRKKIPA